MTEHYCLHNKRDHKKALTYLQDRLYYWKTELLLRSWEFTMEELDEAPPRMNASLKDPALFARTYCSPNYKQARITIYLDTSGCIAGEQIDNLACHETLHVMLSPISDVWETSLINALDNEEHFDLLQPLLYGPEEGVVEDLVFTLMKDQPRPKTKKKARRKKK